MARVGIAGIGFMGMVHYLTYQKIAGLDVVAISELRKERLEGDWTAIKGNFGPAGTRMDLSGIAKYERAEQLLADPDVELVDICLPPAAHADLAVKALEAGKHVFCEKPMALTVADTERMVAAANQSGRLLLIGHVLAVFPEYQFAYQAAVTGRVRPAAGRAFQTGHLRPAVAAELLQPERGRRPHARSAHPRRPFHPPAVRHAARPSPAAAGCGAKWSSTSPRSSNSTTRRWW